MILIKLIIAKYIIKIEYERENKSNIIISMNILFAERYLFRKISHTQLYP